MALEIHQLKSKTGTKFIPVTTTDAVVHPQIRETLSGLINDYNVSVLFPTSGTDSGNKYTLDSMIALLNGKLTDQQKVVGVKGSFLDSSGVLNTYEFIGSGEFSSSSSWTRFDSSFILGKISNISGNEVSLKGFEVLGDDQVTEEQLTPIPSDTVNKGIAKLHRAILNNEEVDAAAVTKIKESVGLGDDLGYTPTNSLISGTTSISEAVETIAETIGGGTGTSLMDEIKSLKQEIETLKQELASIKSNYVMISKP